MKSQVKKVASGKIRGIGVRHGSAAISAAASWALAAITIAGSSVNAATLWWDNSGGTANSWGDVNNWSTTVGGGSTPGAIPGASDVATFSATPIVGTAQTVNLLADRSVQGIAFAAVTQPVTLRGGGTTRTLTIGSSGITSESTASAGVSIGSFDAGLAATITSTSTRAISTIPAPSPTRAPAPV